jgi:AcrR family transcriptional regulator
MVAPPVSKRTRTRNALLIAVQQELLAGDASSLSVSGITTRAGVAHGTFYNHFDSLEEALDGVGGCILLEHSRVLDQAVAGARDRAEVFSLSTRQSLGIIAHTPGYGRLMFDSGLPVDRLAAGIRARLHADVLLGMDAGTFKVANPEVTVSMIAGSVLGVSLDLHRGVLPATAIDSSVEPMLRLLGITAQRAARLAHEPHDFLAPRPVPLSCLIDLLAK